MKFLSCCRPATIVSYAIAGLSALLSSFCYAEYAVDYPIAGGAFTFISLTYGELCGWCALTSCPFMSFLYLPIPMRSLIRPVTWLHIHLQGQKAD